MEVERQNLAEAVTLAERKYSEEKKKVDELQQQVKLHRSSLESSKQELLDYKQKATRILQVSTSVHPDMLLTGRHQHSKILEMMCWMHCPATLRTPMKRVETLLILPLPASHFQLAPFISDDAVVAKHLCYAPLVVPIKTAVTNVAFNFSSERKSVLLFDLG